MLGKFQSAMGGTTASSSQKSLVCGQECSGQRLGDAACLRKHHFDSIMLLCNEVKVGLQQLHAVGVTLGPAGPDIQLGLIGQLHRVALASHLHGVGVHNGAPPLEIAHSSAVQQLEVHPIQAGQLLFLIFLEALPGEPRLLQVPPADAEGAV